MISFAVLDGDLKVHISTVNEETAYGRIINNFCDN